MSELTINLEKLKHIAVVWKRKHPAIESIRLVYATHYLTDHNYYKAILIAIVPKPDEDYLDWVKDPGASHIRNEVEQFGLEEVMWLTCKDIAEAEEWVIDLTESRTIRDNGVGSTISLGRTSPTTSAGLIAIESPSFYKSEEGLKVLKVRAPSITSAEGADIIWVNLTETPDKDKVCTIPPILEAAAGLKGIDEQESKLESITPETPDKPTHTPAPEHIDPEAFIRSLQVSYLDNTEIKIQYKGKRIDYTCQSIGFRDSKTKAWVTFLEILKEKNNVYRLGPARSFNKELKQRIRVKEYDRRFKLLKSINEKLIFFLTQQYHVSFPPDFKLYEPQADKGPGVYSFIFKIPSHKPSYKTKGQALRLLETLIQEEASNEKIQQATETAMDAGATTDEVSEIVKDRLTSQQKYSEITDEPEDGDEDKEE